MNTSDPTRSTVQLSPRASQQVFALSQEDYARYEDALVELSIRLAMGTETAQQSQGGEHLLDLDGCSLVYRLDDASGNILLRRVYCSPESIELTRPAA